jgi:hypothetical protein
MQQQQQLLHISAVFWQRARIQGAYSPALTAVNANFEFIASKTLFQSLEAVA